MLGVRGVKSIWLPFMGLLWSSANPTNLFLFPFLILIILYRYILRKPKRISNSHQVFFLLGMLLSKYRMEPIRLVYVKCQGDVYVDCRRILHVRDVILRIK